MDPNTELTKLASELTDRVEFLEKENSALKQAIKAQQKSASVVKEQVKEASDASIQATCDALVNAGAITAEQVEQTKQAFREDPEASYRTICGILDAQAQAKSASQTQASNVDGGVLVDGSSQSKTAEENCLDKLQRILGM